jgi:hypothetical protein
MRTANVLLIGLLLIIAGALLARQETVHSASPGATVVPLLSCPNVDGSSDDKVVIADILAVVQAYFKDHPSVEYVFMYDLNNPLNPETNTGGQLRVDDILAVLSRYFDVCPKVDTEVAQATRWIITDHPELRTENVGALSALGYVGIATVDVPGQGVHYAKFSTWDGTFNPAVPEGLVYDEGRLAAQLYVVNGASVGWVPEDPGLEQGPCGDGIDNGGDTVADAADPDCVVPPATGAPPDDIDIDTIAFCGTGVSCSWSTEEGWHLHYRFCILHIGTSFARFHVMPDGSTHADCKAINAAEGGAGTAVYLERIGWMGHLWNWKPNANRIDDVDGTLNGRFADCFPDLNDPDNPPNFVGWKSHNCPQ